MARPEKPIKIQKFSGIDNVKGPQVSGSGHFQEMSNVEVDNSSGIRRRDGYREIYTGNVHSLVSNGIDLLFREGNSLKVLRDDRSVSELRTDMYGSNTVRGLLLNNILYYSDGVTSGVYENGESRNWGITPPPQPVLGTTVGDLLAGNYRVSLTYLTRDGRESGSSKPAYIDSTEGGVTISVQASSDSQVAFIAVYMSSTDGEIAWRQTVLENTDTSFTISGALLASGVPLITAEMYPPPGGVYMVFYRGRIYMANDNIVWYTEPWLYELCQLDRNFLPFQNRVTMLGAVENGLWIGTDKEVMFLSGSDPMADGGLVVKNKMFSKVIYGTCQSIDSQYLSLENITPGQCMLWASPDGIFVGDGNGSIINVTGEYFAPPDSLEGVSHIIKKTGSDQYVFGAYLDNGEDGVSITATLT